MNPIKERTGGVIVAMPKTKDEIPDNMRKVWTDAGQKARDRDLKNNVQKDLDDISKKVDNLQNKKGNSKRQPKVFISYDEKKNETAFTQILDDNLEYITQVHFEINNDNVKYYIPKKGMKITGKPYLTPAERLLMYDVAKYIEPESNQLYDADNDMFMTITRISELIFNDHSQVSEHINSLVNKGILLQGNVSDSEITMKDGTKRIGKPRQLYMNPELFCKSDKNQINATLCSLLRTAYHSKFNTNIDKLEKLGILLPYKIAFQSGMKYGKIVTRKTYLEKQRKVQKQRTQKNDQ